MKNKREKIQKLIIRGMFGWGCAILFASCGTVGKVMENSVSIQKQGCTKENEELEERSMPVNSTIYVDNPINENMAGMLQDVTKGASVQIYMNQVGGSGVIWRQEEEQLVIVTAAHVLAEDSGQVQITFADGYSVESSEYTIEASADVAFVYVPVEKIPQECINAYCRVNVDKGKYDEITSGDIVIACGSVSEPGGEAYEGILIENWIWIEDFNQYMMLAKLVVESGMSGGAVFDEEGYFLGILCGVNENNEAAILPLVIIESAYMEHVQ